MNQALEAARAAWAQAEEHAKDLAQKDVLAAAAWREALAEQQAVIERLAAGGKAHRADYTQAGQVAKDREIASKFSDAVARAARLRADEAHMAYLQEAAEDIGERYRAAEQSVFVDSVELDYRVSRAREQAEKVRRSETHRAAIAEEARQHNLSLESLVNGGQRVQPILAKLHNSEWPRARLPNHATAHEAPQLRVELVRSERGFQTQAAGVFDRVLHQTAEQVAIASGIVPPAPPPPPPVPDAQQEPEESEPAAEFAVAAE